MNFECHIQIKKRFKKGRFFKTTTQDSVITVTAIDETHCKLKILRLYGLWTKIFTISEKTKQNGNSKN